MILWSNSKSVVKKGLIHVYLKTGDLRETAAITSKLDGILGTGVQVGNSDVSQFIYEDSDQLIGTIEKFKRLESVERVLWSEVYEIPIDPNNVVRSFKRMWNNSPSNKNGNGNGQ